MTTPATMHYILPTPDGSITMTLCGRRIITDRRATRHAVRSGNWITCPECELAKTLADMGLEDMPDDENREDGKAGRPRGWAQPTLFDF